MSARGLYRLAVVLLLIFFGATAAVWPELPDRVPVHFGPGGEADRWSETTLLSWFGLPLTAAALTLFLWWLGRLGARHPGIWSIPDKDRFLRLTEAQRAPIVERLEAFIAALSIMVTVFFAVIQADMYAAAQGRADGLSVLYWVAFAGVMVGSMGGALWLLVRLGRWIEEAEGG